MEGSGGGGVVSGTPGDERDEPEVPPGVVGVVGVALRPLLQNHHELVIYLFF